MSKGPLGQLAEGIYRWSVGQGFYEDGGRPFDGQLALIHSEVSEALEHWRDGHEPGEAFMVRAGIAAFGESGMVERGMPVEPGDVDDAIEDGWKPDGVPFELADVLIRVLDTMAHLGLDPDELVAVKMAYNRTRPHRNGGKRT